MTLVKWHPRQEFDVSREIDRLVNTFWGDFNTRGQEGAADWRPRVDVAEREDAFVFAAEVPGLKREDVKVTLKEGVLTLEGEKRQESDGKGDEARWSERRYGKFSRSFRLPSDVDAGKVSASYSDGVLGVTVPKAETAKPREIDVKVS